MSIGTSEYEVENRQLQESQFEVLEAVTKMFSLMKSLIDENSELRLSLENIQPKGLVFPFHRIPDQREDEMNDSLV